MRQGGLCERPVLRPGYARPEQAAVQRRPSCRWPSLKGQGVELSRPFRARRRRSRSDRAPTAWSRAQEPRLRFAAQASLTVEGPNNGQLTIQNVVGHPVSRGGETASPGTGTLTAALAPTIDALAGPGRLAGRIPAAGRSSRPIPVVTGMGDETIANFTTACVQVRDRDVHAPRLSRRTATRSSAVARRKTSSSCRRRCPTSHGPTTSSRRSTDPHPVARGAARPRGRPHRRGR